MSLLASLETWNAQRNAFRLVRVGRDNPESGRVELETTELTAVPGLTLSAHEPEPNDRVVLSFSVAIPAVAAMVNEASERIYEIRDAVAAIARSRPGMVTCAAVAGDDGMTLEIGTVIYGDGFSRHALNAAVQDMVKAYAAAEILLDEMVITARVTGEHQALPSSRAAEPETACESCGYVNPPVALVCNQCGEPISAEPA